MVCSRLFVSLPLAVLQGIVAALTLDEIGCSAEISGIANKTFPCLSDIAAIYVLRPYRQIEGFIVGDGIAPMTERTFARVWQRKDRTIDLHGATPHTFRHTYITLAASSGIDVKTLQSIAGHSDIKMTMDRYAHNRDEKNIEAGAQIGGVFSSL